PAIVYHLPTLAAAYDRRRSRGKALSAVYGGVNKLESSIFPSLHHRKEGWPSESQNIAKLPLIARPGWFSDRKPKGKPPRLRLLRWLRNILLTTQPPLLAVMQGGEWRSTVIHSQLHRPALQTLLPTKRILFESQNPARGISRELIGMR